MLDERPPSEGPLKALVLREPLQGDVDRALELFGIAIDDVGEHTALRGFAHVSRVLADSNAITGHEASRTISAIRPSACSELQSEPDEGHVGRSLSVPGAHFLDVDLTRDHVVAQPCHDLRQQLEAFALLIRDQNAEMLGSVSIIPSVSRRSYEHWKETAILELRIRSETPAI